MYIKCSYEHINGVHLISEESLFIIKMFAVIINYSNFTNNEIFQWFKERKSINILSTIKLYVLVLNFYLQV